ncbi:MAG: S8 family serine peptidase, partial [Actinomycetota bacterium]|nr:S8 family serine peptidase [Actinomycetota bacterium]
MADEPSDMSQYVLLPPHGLRATASTSDLEVRDFLVSAEDAIGARGLNVEGRQIGLNVIDSISPDGAKLVEASPEAALAIRSLRPSVRVVPLHWYAPAVVRPREVERGPDLPQQAATPGTITLKVVSKSDQSPIVGAFVVAFVDFTARSGAQGVTDASGQVSLALGGPAVALQRLYVYPLGAYWTLIKKDFAATDGLSLALVPLDLAYTDSLRNFYGDAKVSVGAGVTVGVIDTGVANHPDLVIAGGANTVPGEDPTAFGDNGQHHGTHVAGIIAARGTPPQGLRGVAPGVTLRAYRVFGQGNGSASSFAIAKAIDLAVTDKCDLLNLSLGGGPTDPVLKAAVDAARAGGSLCIIAAGNGSRAPVSFPANDELAIAVSAMGRTGTFPTSAAEADDVAAPFGSDKADFIAD